jgi:hypothetical protein
VHFRDDCRRRRGGELVKHGDAGLRRKQAHVVDPELVAEFFGNKFIKNNSIIFNDFWNINLYSF